MKIYIVNAFVKDGKGGNPAGVVLNADEFTKEQKQKIAADLGLSETAFVSRSDRADFLLEFYTPNKQIPHCGHATIGTFSLMDQLGLLSNDEMIMQTIAGSNSVFRKDGMIFMEQQAPRYIRVKDVNAVFESLAITSSDVVGDPVVVNTGNSFLLTEVKNSDVLAALRKDDQRIIDISAEYDLIGFYIFSRKDTSPADATTRMFGPYYQIPEEAATGMAAGPLACYLHDISGTSKDRFLIYQGFFMTPPSPSEVVVTLNIADGNIGTLLAGGKGVAVKQIEI
jgi:PhzF family phenazine biosynthesis protein